MIRSARRMADRVGYDPDTGLHSGYIPQVDDKSRTVMDGEFSSALILLHVSLEC